MEDGTIGGSFPDTDEIVGVVGEGGSEDPEDDEYSLSSRAFWLA